MKASALLSILAVLAPITPACTSSRTVSRARLASLARSPFNTEQRTPGRGSGEGLLAGIGVGLLLGTGFAMLADDDCGSDSLCQGFEAAGFLTAARLGMVIAAGAGGAIAGGIVGGSVGHKTISEAAEPERQLTVVPLRGGAGVGLTTRF